MLKTRLIASIIAKNQLVVQSFGFKRYLPIGDIKTAIEFFVNWDVDEILILDIDASKENRKPNVDLVKWAVGECFVPLAVGGGISDLHDINNLLKAGADKVCINNVMRKNSNFIRHASNTFGAQCITASVDITSRNGSYQVFDYLNNSVLEQPLEEYVQQIEEQGAGEILVNSVENDGARTGYNNEMLLKITESVNIPVIALGGIGRFDQLSAGVKIGGAQAVAAANIFQHVEHSTIAAKAQMRKDELEVRLSSEVKYEDFNLDFLGRPY